VATQDTFTGAWLRRPAPAADALVDEAVAVVLAGGKGTRLGALTRRICKPALPFGAAYRSIDFALANCVNSGINRVGVATQHRPDALLSHLDRVWRDFGTEPGHFIRAWPSQQRAPGLGYSGTADAVYRNLDVIEALGRRLVLVLAGDHVYQMDYRPMLEQHCESGAPVTIGCVPVPIEEAHEFGVLSVDRRDRIERFVEKPKTVAAIPGRAGTHVLASMGIYVFDAEFLARALRLDAAAASSRHDFGGDVLPRVIREAEAFAYPFRAADGVQPAYWRDIGTITAYWRAHMELLGSSPRASLNDPNWPLPTAEAAPQLIAHRNDARGRGTIENSLVAAGCSVSGTVRHSVLFGGVEVRRGAEIVDSVVLPGAVIGRGCRLRGVVVDSGHAIADGTRIDQSASGTVPRDRLQPAVLAVEEGNGAWAHAACAIA